MPRAIALDNEALRILQLAGLSEDAFEKIAIPEVRMHSRSSGNSVGPILRGASTAIPNW